METVLALICVVLLIAFNFVGHTITEENQVDAIHEAKHLGNTADVF